MDSEMARYRRQQSREYLKDIRELFVRVRALEADIELQREAAAGVTGIDYTRPVVDVSAYGDAIPDAVSRLLDSIAECCAELAECAERQDEARKLLDQMGGTGADVLRLRYVCALPWKDVADRVNFSPDWAKHIERDALSEFYDYLPPGRRDPMHPAI